MRKSVWLLSAAFVTIASPAIGQTTPPADPAQPADPAAATQAQPAAPAQMDEIVITAQGRRQLLQNVPIAVTAVGGQEMALSGATDIRQLNQLAPSLLVSSTSTEANGSARIRGIGTVGDNPGLESSVAVFVDGVYRSRSGIGLNELGEIDHVEVLRGPQGTLFGRNASAGLIHVFSKKPAFNWNAYGEATVGNYDMRRLEAGITGPLADSIAFRLEGVWLKRDGFYRDDNNDTDVNNRNRYFTRGQLLFQPNSDLSIRLIGDYTHRTEKCCGAIYVNNKINDKIGDLTQPAQPPLNNDPDGNNIINVLGDLGQDLSVFEDGWHRHISVSPGRSYKGTTTDGGVSMEIDNDFGGVNLTSITAYRGYKSEQNGDFDYSTVDILYRKDSDPNYRKFRTFSQELRLQGSAFSDKLDWLVGGYYANEHLTLADSLRFGDDYGRFAACRLVSGSALAALYNPAAAGCLAARPAAFGAASPAIYAAIDRLDGMSDAGSTGDIYKQKSNNWALFTHNIFHVTSRFDVTVGLRYTHEKKDFDAAFHNDNVACTQNQGAIGPFLANPALAQVVGAIISLSCQGNSTAELNGVTISDKRKEHKLTGTGVLSYKATDDLLLYGSFSRGYKAGGFNLDRSALKGPVFPFAATPGGAQALVGGLQFDPETVDAFELGGKFTARGVTFNVSLFRQDFKNFQLNTFDGTVFIVQNVNGCDSDLGGADQDQSKFSTAPNFNAAAATTGACASGDVGHGVRSQGVELEASARVMPDLRLNAGFTYASTKYRGDLVGRDDGSPLNQALRRLPGQQISNAPKMVVTGSASFTPRLGDSGLSALFYIDGRYSSSYNTGSDLFPQKRQEGFGLVNARVGLRGRDQVWSVEVWAQNLLNKDYQQVAFNSPFQEGATGAPFTDPAYPGGRQIFSTFLAEPRTFGLTLRAQWSPPRPVVETPPAPPPPPPPPPPPATQTCPDGAVILATDTCPVPPPPPPPPAPAPERGL